jgi:integrase
MELALVLAEATGRRLGAIRQLRWEDVEFDHAEITWRADSDKKGVMWVVPMPDALLKELQDFQRRLGAIGGWGFFGERIPAQPMDRHLFDKWLATAEREAKLPKLAGGLWHPYCRKWAMERKHWPLSDVAAVGGWKDVETLLKYYSQADRRTMLSVMSEPTKLQSADVSAARMAQPDAASRLVGVQH